MATHCWVFHNGGVGTLLCCSAADNSRIVSGAADRLVMLTDVSTGKPIRKFRGHISVSESLHVQAMTQGMHYTCTNLQWGPEEK